MPSDFEDEEIDEDTAFTAEDKIKYAGMFGSDAEGASGSDASESLLESDEEPLEGQVGSNTT